LDKGVDFSSCKICWQMMIRMVPSEIKDFIRDSLFPIKKLIQTLVSKITLIFFTSIKLTSYEIHLIQDFILCNFTRFECL